MKRAFVLQRQSFMKELGLISMIEDKYNMALWVKEVKGLLVSLAGIT